ncbi:NAD-dependent epimerase/dehydratase family protein [Pseudonocardiaceae bacterium YIM PH 21723]|nr:NAD-dependent epimerase/dehydratase family protein [Pseudonocardiaceae bacterium YIM PH 21723]
MTTTTQERSPILVTGATGTQGGATARRLLAAGRPVRALVRDLNAPAATELAALGAQLVRGDLDDPAGLKTAVAGAVAVFAVPPLAFDQDSPDTGTEARRGRALIDAVVAAGIDRVVLTTGMVLPEESALSAGKLAIEQYLWERVRLATVLRPGAFMTNYLWDGQHGFDGIVDGVNRHLYPADIPVQYIAPADTAEFAALAFADPERFAGRTLNLAGDSLTPVAAAATVAAATGIPVRYREIADDELPALFQRMRTGLRTGRVWSADLDALRVIHPGLRTLSGWLAESGAADLRLQQADRQ